MEKKNEIESEKDLKSLNKLAIIIYGKLHL